MTTLSQPNKAFGNLPPCPYAKKAWLDGNVEVRMFTTFEEFEKGPWNKEVTIYVTDMSAWDLQEAAHDYNQRFPAYLFLEEHPDLTEEVDGFLVNQGEYGMLIVQERRPLEDARRALMKNANSITRSQALVCSAHGTTRECPTVLIRTPSNTSTLRITKNPITISV